MKTLDLKIMACCCGCLCILLSVHLFAVELPFSIILCEGGLCFGSWEYDGDKTSRADAANRTLLGVTHEKG